MPNVHSASTESEVTAKDYQKLYEAQTEHVVFQIGIQNEYREQRDELIEVLRDLVEVSEIAVSFGIVTDRPDMNGPLPRARALLAKLKE